MEYAASIYEVTECVPSRTFTWEQRFPGGILIGDHHITQRGGGIEVKLSFSSSGLLGNILGKVFSRLIRNYVGTEAHSLKNRCDLLAHHVHSLHSATGGQDVIVCTSSDLD